MTSQANKIRTLHFGAKTKESSLERREKKKKKKKEELMEAGLLCVTFWALPEMGVSVPFASILL